MSKSTVKKEINKGPVIEKEKETVERMIKFYCEKRHKRKELCEQCDELLTYAHKRLSYCPFGEEKKACSNCSIHCYKQDYREEIIKVMRFAGPRMLLYHPFYSIRHLRWTRSRR